MKRLLIGTLLSLSSSSIFANDSYFVGEILLGSTDQEVSGDSGKDTSLGLRGTYNINPYIGIELSYQYYGEAEWSYPNGYGGTVNEKTDPNSINLGIKGVLPIKNAFFLDARVGMAFWTLDVDIIDSRLPSFNFGGSDSNIDMYIGLGVHHTLNEKFIIGIEYLYSKFDASLDARDPYGPMVINADLRLETLAFTAGFKI